LSMSGASAPRQRGAVLSCVLIWIRLSTTSF
jgi:hypothetical protein